MSRYYDYSNGISWQNQALQGGGVSGQKETSRGPPQPPLYQHAPHPGYTSAAQDSRVVMPVAPRPSALYAQSMYHQYPQSKAQASVIPSFPVLPDVRLKRLPYYDILAEILKPSSLLPTTAQRVQEAMYPFYLTPNQATEIACGRDLVGIGNKVENIVQVQLRFCLVETSCEQDDYFPPSCAVKVNGKVCQLPSPIPTNKPGVEPKRPPRPVNITGLMKLSPTVANTISVNWANDFTRNYALSVNLVRKLTPTQLLTRLKNKGTKNADYTRSLIKEKLRDDVDCEIAATSLRVSLTCPLGRMRMKCPCRPTTCEHFQCFDASLFLQMNEKKPTWLCPVCYKPALYDTLVVDGYFQDVLSSPQLDEDCCEVQLYKDGSWTAQKVKKEDEMLATPTKETVCAKSEPVEDLDVIPLSDGSNSSTGPPKRSASSTNSNNDSSNSTTAPAETASNNDTPAPRGVVDLTSDSEDDLPLKKKASNPDSTPANHSETTPHIKYNDVSGSAASSVTGVSSSGYQSPAPSAHTPTLRTPPAQSSAAIISLDSPSPPPTPASPTPTPAPAHQASLSLPRAAAAWQNQTPPSHPPPRY